MREWSVKLASPGSKDMVLVVVPVYLLIKGGAWAFRGLDGARGLWMKRGCMSFNTCGEMRCQRNDKWKEIV
jgi:hypothetical protein